jgi:hypothetical protein|nr:MAG TPA: hypothetical protein [Caudoviricetes sp.]
MDKFIGQDIESLKERELFIKDNAEAVENMGYSKPLSSAEIDKLKEKLADACIQHNAIAKQKKVSDTAYNSELKELIGIINATSDKLKSKSEYVSEPCYKLIDEDEKTAGYYNKEGMLVYERPARQDELQPMLFKRNATRTKTGAEDK